MKLAIEIDGRTHDFKVKYDQLRQNKLESFGITFLRFTGEDAKHHTQSVINEIQKWVTQNTDNPLLSPPWEGNS